MSSASSRKVLLVDDDDLLRDMYRRLLSRQFDIAVATGAAEAIDRLSREGPFAVVMSDFRMPGVNGVELLRQVRRTWPETSRILVSGLICIPEMTGDPGLATIMAKPCPYEEVVETLQKAISSYQDRTALEEPV